MFKKTLLKGVNRVANRVAIRVANKKPTAKKATVGITQTTSHKEYQNMNFDIAIITN